MSEFPNDYNRSWTEPPPRSRTDTIADTPRSYADRARSYAPKTYDRSVQAANYVGGSIREHPFSASAVLPLLGYVLGFLLHHQSSDVGSESASPRDQAVNRGVPIYSDRSRTDAAANAAQSVADRARPAATETYDRSAQAMNSVAGSIGLAGLIAAAVLGYALGLVQKSDQEQRARGEWDRVQ